MGIPLWSPSASNSSEVFFLSALYFIFYFLSHFVNEVIFISQKKRTLLWHTLEAGVIPLQLRLDRPTYVQQLHTRTLTIHKEGIEKLLENLIISARKILDIKCPSSNVIQTRHRLKILGFMLRDLNFGA